MDDFRYASLDSEIEGYWDKRAKSYSNSIRGELADNRHAAWKRSLEHVAGDYIIEARREGRTARALDLGCGPGFFSIVLAELGCAVDAVDASSQMLDHARANVTATSYSSQISFHESDVLRLPFDNNAFDVALSRNLTWVVLDPEAAYAEWLRVLRPGGKLVVYDANWYLYLVNEEIDAQRRLDQENNVLEGIAENARATAAQVKHCEEIAEQLPLTSVLRPAWDLETLPRLGASRVRADEGVWKELWTESEQAYYASSPLFLIEAIK